MTLPQVESLMRFWAHTPPASLALKRISLALGLKATEPKVVAKTAGEAKQLASEAGIPVIEGRPDDPVLDMLDKAGW